MDTAAKLSFILTYAISLSDIYDKATGQSKFLFDAHVFLLKFVHVFEKVNLSLASLSPYQI